MFQALNAHVDAVAQEVTVFGVRLNEKTSRCLFAERPFFAVHFHTGLVSACGLSVRHVLFKAELGGVCTGD